MLYSFPMHEDPLFPHTVNASEKKSFTTIMKLGVAFAIVLVVGFVGGYSVRAGGASQVLATIPLLGDGLDASPSADANFSDFWKVWNTLNDRYVQTHASTTIPDTKKKMWGAIQGLTSSYGDPYTVFFPPAEAKAFQEQIAGNFGGIGAELGMTKENILTVIAPLKDSPAEKAGVRSGDLIAAINGKSTEGISTDAAVKEIRGPKGTSVTLTLIREKKRLDIKVVRDTIQVPNIDNSYDAKTGVYYIALYELSMLGT